VAGRNATALARGDQPSAPPRTTAIGALGYYVSHADPAHYAPTNITFGIVAPIDAPKKANRKAMLAERALADLAHWAEGSGSGALDAAAEPALSPEP
jgi:methylenetetrahydrofolate--tRNA-(uracil-5-)-methyltransferase